jgi:hypothetical protein
MNKNFIETQTRASLLENTGFNSLYTYGLYLVKQTQLEGYNPLGTEDDISERSESYRKLKSLYESIVKDNFNLLRLNVNDYVWTNYYKHDEQHQSGFESAAEDFVISQLDWEDEACEEKDLIAMFRRDYGEYFEFHEFMHHNLHDEVNAQIILDVLRLLDGDYRLMNKDLQNHDLHDLIDEVLYASMLREVENDGCQLIEYLWNHLFAAWSKNSNVKYDYERRTIVVAFLLSIESNTQKIRGVVEMALPYFFAKTPKPVRLAAINNLEVEA